MLGSLESGTFGNGRFITADQEWGFWGADNILFLDLDDGYMDVFIYKLYTYELYTFLFAY